MRPERGQLLGLMTKERREEGQEQEWKAVLRSEREAPVFDTGGESGRWPAALISCPQSVYGIEQIQHNRCAGDRRTASNGHGAG